MATLQGKKVVVIGGSSGIGYAVAKASLLSLAAHVTIASSSQAKVAAAVARLIAEPELQKLGADLKQRVAGGTLDLGDTKAVGAFFEKIGEVDHLVITSGRVTSTFPWREGNLDSHKGQLNFSHTQPYPPLISCYAQGEFDLRFWGPATAAQKVKLREGGSITFTIGTTFLPQAFTRRLTPPDRNWCPQAATHLGVDHQHGWFSRRARPRLGD